MTTRLAVTGMAASANGRTITLDYTRAPEPDEAMDAREWADVRRDFVALAREQQARHGKTVEVYGQAPECEDWMVACIEPAEGR